MKMKGGMYCPACERPVMAVKNTHRLRNTAAIVTAPVGFPFAKVEGYICPNCGGPVGRVKKERQPLFSLDAARQRADQAVAEYKAQHPEKFPPKGIPTEPSRLPPPPRSD